MVEFDVYEYSIIHIGMEVVFHHPESEKLRLSRDTENKYGLDKEHARIFTESASEQTFNAEEMLAGYINSSGKRLGEHILARLDGDTPPRRMAITFPIQFNAQTFHMMTNKGLVDIKTLRLAVEVGD
jgi:hypothetical protein